MMSDDDDDDYDANERTLSRWRARISREKHIAIIGTRSVEPRFTRVSFAGRATHRIEWNRHERRRTQSLNARTEWVKYKNLSYTTCTTAGVFIKSRNNHPSICSSVSFQTQRASRSATRAPDRRARSPLPRAVRLLCTFDFICAAVLLFRSPLFVKR